MAEGRTNTLISGPLSPPNRLCGCAAAIQEPFKAGGAGKQRENKPLRDCQTRKWAGGFIGVAGAGANRFFNGFSLTSPN